MRFELNHVLGFLMFLGVIFVSIVLQSTLINGILSPYLYPDILLAVIVYIGLRRELTEGILWTLFISLTYAVHSGFTSLSSSLLMLLVFFAARYIGRNFYLVTLKEYFLGLAVPIFAQKLLLLLWLYWHNVSVMPIALLQAVTTTICSVFVGLLILKMLTRLDVWSERLDSTSLIGKKD
jgi:hypothetical protein